MKKRLIVAGLVLSFAAPMAHASGWDWLSFFGQWFTTNPSIANN